MGPQGVACGKKTMKLSTIFWMNSWSQIQFGKKEHPFKKNHRHKGRSEITIAEWPKKVFKNKIVNRL